MPVNKTRMPFNEWYNTVPENKRDTSNYRLRYAYENNLIPQDQLDAFVSNPDAHLMSAYYNPITGNYDFIKSKNHPTHQLELDWYNGNTPDARKFRRNYTLTDNGSDFMEYTRNKKLPSYDMGTTDTEFSFVPGKYSTTKKPVVENIVPKKTKNIPSNIEQKKDNTQTIPRRISNEPYINTTSDFVYDPATGRMEQNPNAKRGLEIVSPEFDLLTLGGVNSITKLVSKQSIKSAFDKTIRKKSDNFISEINWGKWNSEIPLNKTLMKEYNLIEKTTKQNGTWMKNADGSNFSGTAEQFVQQSSNNFKKSFPNNVNENLYHGSDARFDKIDESKFGKTDGGVLGKGLYVTPSKKYAESYGDNVYQLYVNSKNPLKTSSLTQAEIKQISMYKKELKTKSQLIKENRNDLLINKKIANETGDTYDTPYKLARSRQAKINSGDIVSKESFSKKINESDFIMHDAGRYSKNNIGYEQAIIPFSNRVKSAIGNNGMFDMTNPNIYKGLIPAVGLYGLSKNKQN